MNIFFSWSKKKSRDLAIVTKNFIEGLFRSDIKIWISSEDIDYGAMAMVDINKALKDSDMCIAFIVEENLSSPWIMFETGAIAGRMHLEKNHTIENTVVPIIFDRIADEKFQGHPLNQFQRLVFSKESFKKLVKQLNNIVKTFENDELLNTQFNLNWSILNKLVRGILSPNNTVGKTCVNCEYLMEELDKYKFPSPVFGPIIKYESGFETQNLYDVLLKNANKRLWFFGRKNRKLFSTENRDFFQKLGPAQKKGLDFRCLFLNPNSENIKKAQRGIEFKNKLLICIKEAQNVLSLNNVNYKSVCKFYSTQRTDEIIIIDNVVLYSHITYSDDEYPCPLTKAPFYMINVESSIGKEYYEKFENAWNSGENFTVL